MNGVIVRRIRVVSYKSNYLPSPTPLKHILTKPPDPPGINPDFSCLSTTPLPVSFKRLRA